MTAGAPRTGELPTAESWPNAKKKALKILGEKGKLPDDKPIYKGFEAYAKVYDTFDKSRGELEAKITELQGQMEKYSSQLDQFETTLEKDKLGLNDKDKEETKEIDLARSILCDSINETIKDYDDDIKNLKAAARHIILLGQYKIQSL